MEKVPRPTDAELAVLAVLWENGASTVKQVDRALAASRKTGYTTVPKFLQIMLDKALVTRDASTFAHVYKAAIPQEQTERTLVADLLERAFQGSTSRLVLQALAAKKASPEELAEIRKILRKHERGDK
jgi:predicted transcriptional regulator